MAQFKTSNGYTVTVDDEDFAWVTRHSWYGNASKSKGLVYIQRTQWGVGRRQQLIYLHRAIIGAERGQHVDHRNGDTLDNRRDNLRLCTHAQNMGNRRVPLKNKTGFKGVRENHRGIDVRFDAQCGQKRLGTFATAEEAAAVYDAAAKEAFREFARLNTKAVDGTSEQKGSVRSSSGYRGVYQKTHGCFQVVFHGKHVGCRSTAVSAAHLYDNTARAKLGPKARLNFPEQAIVEV